MENQTHTTDILTDEILYPSLRNPLYIFPEWFKQDTYCFVNGKPFFFHPRTRELTNPDGSILQHNGEAIIEITEIYGTGNRQLKTADNKIPVFAKTASGKRRMLQASRNQNNIFEIESKILIAEPSSDSQWLRIHSIVFTQEGLFNEKGDPIVIRGHKIQEVAFRDGNDILVELDDETTAWIRIAETRFITVMDESYPVGMISVGGSIGNVTQLYPKSLGYSQGIEIFLGHNGGLQTKNGQEILVNGITIKEIAYNENSTILLLELVDGSEVAINIRKNQTIVDSTRESIEMIFAIH